MPKKSRIDKEALKLVVNALKAERWKVRNNAHGECIYTTSTGRTSTVVIQPYLPRLWRWQVDNFAVRIPGKLELVSPQSPPGMVGNTELTVFEDELISSAEWLAQRIIAMDAGREPPACPVELENGKLTAGNNTWSAKANAEYYEQRKKPAQGISLRQQVKATLEKAENGPHQTAGDI